MTKMAEECVDSMGEVDCALRRGRGWTERILNCGWVGLLMYFIGTPGIRSHGES